MRHEISLTASIADVLRRIRRRRTTFAFTLIAATAATAGVCLVLPVSYSATATILVTGDESVLNRTATPLATRTGDPLDIESQSHILSSPRMLNHLIDDPAASAAWVRACEAGRAGSLTRTAKDYLRTTAAAPYLQPDVPCEEIAGDRARMRAALADNLKVATAGRSRVIAVTFTSRDPETAALLANTLAERYLDEERARKVQPREAAISWLSAEVGRLDGEIRRSEGQIEAFRRQNGIVQGSQSVSIANESLSALARELATAQAERASATAQLQVASGDPTLRATRDRAEERVRAMQRQFSELSRQVAQQSNAEVSIAGMQRNVDAQRVLFGALSSRLNEMRVEERLITADSRLVSEAVVPLLPAGPGPSRIAIGGLVLAGVLASMAALAKDLMDRTVKALPQVTGETGIPVLALIPRIGVGRAGLGAMTWDRMPPTIQDSIRGLYGRTILMRPQNGPHALMITSAEAGAGKTFLTIALARMAAAAGQRVLIIECDLRKPTMASALDLTPSGVGLTTYLKEAAEFDNVVRPVRNEGFDVLTAGRAVNESLEYLTDKRMERLLGEARARYDVILLDTPPAGALLDASALARLVPDTLFCIRWGRTREDDVLGCVSELRAAGANVLGLAVNRVQRNTYALYDASRPQRPALAAPYTAAN
ncbi:GumC family protein [Roseomonas sp. GCM10028921]